VVLTFHRILPDAALSSTSSLPGMVVSQSMFGAFLSYLSKRFEVIDLRDASASGVFQNNKLRFAVTFDDGWLDNYEVAQPIVGHFRLPMAVFVCPRKMGTKSPFWPEKVSRLLHGLRTSGVPRPSNSSQSGGRFEEFGIEEACRAAPEKVVDILKMFPPKKLADFIRELESLANAKQSSAADNRYPDQTMSWNQAAQLGERGVTIGSHTLNHSILTQLLPSDVRFEIVGSKREIEAQLGQPCLLFAYPNGNCDPEIRNAVEQAGYALAFTTRPGYWAKGDDPWLIPRINISENSLAGPTAKFSKVAFQYSILWKAFQARWKH